MNEIIEQKIKMLPSSPGVYVMLGSDGQVIYVGKAKVLKNRVKQYFYSGFKTEKVAAMVMNIADFYYIMTDSEIDALSLENNLIKKYKPRYNILLKDDKTYPYLKVKLKDPFPRFEVTRKPKSDGARYFGPFMGGVSVKDVAEIINECYLLRTCTQVLPNSKIKRECLNYHIGRCSAPCTGKIGREDYRVQVEKAIDFLSGNDLAAEEILTERMRSLADEGKFELAIDFRDKLKMLEKIKERKITDLNRFIDLDVISIVTDGIYYTVSMLILRNGRMQGGKNYSVSAPTGDISEALSEFIRACYGEGKLLPHEIVVNKKIDDKEVIEGFFRKNFNKAVNIVLPEKGVKKRLSEMAEKNAEDYLEKTVQKIEHKEDMTTVACERLQKILSLSRYPRRMECYDISNVSGVDKVASMVVFTDGEKDAKEYRRFMIKTVEGANDFASLKEALTRRLSKLGTDEEEKFPKPDLIIIDGGKGQLSSVKEVFDELGVADIDLISLAKREEEIFTVHSLEPVVLPHSDYVLRLMQRIRDEAHRFAITYFRSLHNKRNIASALDEIPGIGKKYKKMLLEAFGSVENMARAEKQDFLKIEGFGEKRAQTLYNFFHTDKDETGESEDEE